MTKPKPHGPVGERLMSNFYGPAKAAQPDGLWPPAGTVVHVNGIPFALKRAAEVDGTAGNLRFALRDGFLVRAVRVPHLQAKPGEKDGNDAEQIGREPA